MDALEHISGEWLEWYSLTPQERWHESGRLWRRFFLLGGFLEPEPDMDSPEWHGIKPICVGFPVLRGRGGDLSPKGPAGGRTALSYRTQTCGRTAPPPDGCGEGWSLGRSRARLPGAPKIPPVGGKVGRPGGPVPAVFDMIDLSKFQNAGFSRGAPAWKEAAWWVVRSLLFAPWFPVPSPLKVAALRLFGAKVGQGVVIRSRVNVTFPWRLEIGDHVWIGDDVFILSLDRVKIGSHVCLSQGVFLCTGSHDHRQAAFDLITGPVVVRDRSWVAARAFVGPGVTAGPGAVIGAGAVVVKDVPEGMAAYGNPAQTRPVR